ncbi:mitochondrial tyrosyl-tRNA synthetase (TyrRS) [Andalucia godoyi]|uniref:Tyrosine--tRNA ligase n=1 Tax=Andalucia godoyi TaxID=505711 RepID=A0A8K0AIL8_ANDGO|nr:mitochondrial tyrosyl-tRNA synthetase (TyrRS) [Andalucia godoyi]|eukprot:ANDGO_04328.mRNA.1 mitochondrial tyrosyl-tRNA synthetase (TyrRS)
MQRRTFTTLGRKSAVHVVSHLRSRGLLYRATDNVAHVLSEFDAAKPFGVYAGFDPTADSLHIGSLAVLQTLKVFAEHGFGVHAVVGGATGMIGDPSGRSAERSLLNREQIELNVQGIRGDIQRVIPNVSVLNNNDWLGKMTFIDFARDVGKKFRVNHMLRLDSMKSRLESSDGISFTEFSYPLLQAFDFSHLFQTRNVRIQVGGSDQWGNITMGSDLIPQSVAGVTIPLLTSASGEKIGKSAGNAVFLSPARTSSYDFYQYLMRMDDATARKLLPMLTTLPIEQCEEASKSVIPNEVQKLLADNVTSAVRGAEELKRALRVSAFLFGSLDLELLLKDPQEVERLFMDAKAPIFRVSQSVVLGKSLLDVLVSAKVFVSKGSLRRLVSEGGLSCNLKRVADDSQIVNGNDLLGGKYLLIRQGKKQYSLIVVH